MKASWVFATAIQAVIFPTMASQDITLTDAEEAVRSAYQKQFQCLDERSKIEPARADWLLQDECLTEATRGLAGIKKPTDLLKQASQIIDRHGFIAVMTDEERPALKLLWRQLDCLTPKISSDKNESQDLQAATICLSEIGASARDQEIWKQITSKYGPYSIKPPGQTIR